jgi:uncharacterized protein YyaL (SSP411 family)
MRHALAFALLFLAIASATSASGAIPNLRNRTLDNPSPYVAMHAGDPVAWQLWDHKALALARAQNKLLFVSIGYFACRWCHVMQHQSWRDRKIARFMNANFVPVVVDRELEPALDARMNAFAARTQGASGWPLNVFITPDGYPLYAVLYLPPKELLGVLQRMQRLWVGNSEGLRQLARHSEPGGRGPGVGQMDRNQVRRLAAALLQEVHDREDPLSGGFGKQSKFPSVPQLDFLLGYLRTHRDEQLEEFVRLTLDQMAGQGLRDQLGGGFFRYTVDPEWQRPHFEKMLYDNALLARLYARAARQFHSPEYSAVARDTMEFMQRSLQRGNGGMISAVSSLDTRGVEGGYYLWSVPELERRLPSKVLRMYRRLRGMVDSPPFADGYLPLGVNPSLGAKAKQLGLTKAVARAVLREGDARLLRARRLRRAPVDGKQLAGWNGLALSAFAESARLDRDAKHRRVAYQIRDFLVATLWNGKRLSRAESNGKGIGQASLEDYAYVARGLTDWALLTGRAGDVELAYRVAKRGWREFYGPHGWRLGGSGLVAPESGQDAVEDGPMPSPAAVLIRTSLELAHLRGDARMRRRCLAALNSGADQVRQNAFWYATRIAVMEAAMGRVSAP